jgi:membrane protein DedA with SNARE-associated domain
MKMGKFLVFTALGAGIWNAVLAALGWYLSKVPGIETKEQLIEKVTVYSHEIGYCFIALGAFIVGYLVYKGYKK